MKSPILGTCYVARSVNAADNRMVNLFPEATPEGGKEAGFLSRCPGLRLLVTVGTGPIRGTWRFGSYGYVVSGLQLYKVDQFFAATLIGTVTGTGPVSMSDNGVQLFVACNPDGYIYNSTTSAFVQITDPDFPGAVTVSYIDGYFTFNEPGTQKVWVTSLLDGLAVDPLDFASAEGAPDNLVALTVDHREVWLFGTNSVEVWYDAGLADFPLARIQGAFNEIGLAAAYSVAKLDNSLFWLGSDARGKGIVYRANGYTGTRMSTHAVEFAIQGYTTISDAIGYTYQQEGHAFYVLSFPSANATWVYDVSVGGWHERASFENGAFIRHRSNCQMTLGGEVVVGDYSNGNLYAFDLDVYADHTGVQRFVRSWRALPSGSNNLTRTAQHSLQLDIEAGVGLDGVTQGDDPLVNLRWSDDGGHTWGNYHTRPIGRIGEYARRVIWRRLGMTTKLRDRVYEISGTDPVKISIMGAQLLASATHA
ncbi:MAG: packaged DNA stabilization protein [Bacteroidales bacterium]